MIAGPGDAASLANCTVPLRDPGTFAEEQTFDDLSRDVISESEHYVCHEIRHPAQVRGWKLQGVDAFRYQFNGNLSWRVHLRFTLGTYSTPSARYLVLVVTKRGMPGLFNATGDVEQIWLGGRPAELVHPNGNLNDVEIRWRQDGLQFEASLFSTPGGEEVELSDLVTFLSSV